jgi:hypothetical protein
MLKKRDFCFWMEAGGQTGFVTMTVKAGPWGVFTEWGNSVRQCLDTLKKEDVVAQIRYTSKEWPNC